MTGENVKVIAQGKNLVVGVTKSQYDVDIASKQNNLSPAQLDAVNSGITADKRAQYDAYATNKQNVLTAGTNVQINGSTISATDTTYTAGTGIRLDGTTINCTVEGFAVKWTDTLEGLGDGYYNYTGTLNGATGDWFILNTLCGSRCLQTAQSFSDISIYISRLYDGTSWSEWVSRYAAWHS